MQTIIAGLIAGGVGGLCFFVALDALPFFGILTFPPIAGLVFGLVRRSKAEAWRASFAGLFGVLIGYVLFILQGTVFLKASLSLINHGIPVQVIGGLTSPYAWGIAWVAATPARMGGSIRGALIAGAIGFIGVNLLTLVEPSTSRLSEWRISGARAASFLGVFLPFVAKGLILGLSVKLSEARGTGDA